MFEQIKAPSLRLTHSSEGDEKVKSETRPAGAEIQPRGDAFVPATIPKADAGSRGQSPDRRATRLRGITAHAVFLVVG